MSCARWFANTNGFKGPNRLSPTGRPRAGNAPANQSAAALKRGRAVQAQLIATLLSPFDLGGLRRLASISLAKPRTDR